MSGTDNWAACADGQSQEHLDSSAKVHASSTDHNLAWSEALLRSSLSALLHSDCSRLITCLKPAPSLPHFSPDQFLAQPHHCPVLPPGPASAPPLLQEVYARPEWADHFDCVVTCFFIDTAHNVVQYVEVIRHCLKEGGFWLNLGPLLYHWCAAGFKP